MPTARLPDLGLGDLADDQERDPGRSPSRPRRRRRRSRRSRPAASSSTPAKGARISVWSSSSSGAAPSAACARLEVGCGFGHLGLGLKALGAELPRRGVLDLAHAQRRLGLLDHRRTGCGRTSRNAAPTGCVGLRRPTDRIWRSASNVPLPKAWSALAPHRPAAEAERHSRHLERQPLNDPAPQGGGRLRRRQQPARAAVPGRPARRPRGSPSSRNLKRKAS